MTTALFLGFVGLMALVVIFLIARYLGVRVASFTAAGLAVWFLYVGAMGYLGLIGSRAKVARIYDELTAHNMPADALKNVHAPIGLDIGAVTPQEIAVSILAELIAVKHGKVKGRDAGELSMKWNNLKA